MEYNVFSAMQADEPLARFKKQIVGKVHVVALNPFSGEPEKIILQGNKDGSYIEVWTEKALVFFERINKEHFNAGRLLKVKEVVKEPPSPNILTDEEIEVLLDGRKTKFFALQKRVGTFTDTAPVIRLLNRARDLDKSETMIKYLEETASELELARYEK